MHSADSCTCQAVSYSVHHRCWIDQYIVHSLPERAHINISLMLRMRFELLMTENKHSCQGTFCSRVAVCSFLSKIKLLGRPEGKGPERTANLQQCADHCEFYRAPQCTRFNVKCHVPVGFCRFTSSQSAVVVALSRLYGLVGRH